MMELTATNIRIFWGKINHFPINSSTRSSRTCAWGGASLGVSEPRMMRIVGDAGHADDADGFVFGGSRAGRTDLRGGGIYGSTSFSVFEGGPLPAYPVFSESPI